MNSQQSRQNSYNCKRCHANGDFERRNCFWYGGEVQEVEAMQAVEDLYGNTTLREGETMHVSSDDFIALVQSIVEVHDRLSLLDACTLVFPAVCPKSLITGGIDQFLSMESFCRDYHVPPLGSDVGYLDYPMMLVDIFGTISVARERVRAREVAEMKAKAGN